MRRSEVLVGWPGRILLKGLSQVDDMVALKSCSFHLFIFTEPWSEPRLSM